MPLVDIPALPAGALAVAAGVLARMLAVVAVGGMPVTVGAGPRVILAAALAVSVAAFPAAMAASPTRAFDGGSLAALIVIEAVVGASIGAAVAMVVSAAGWAGSMLGSVTGLNWADEFGGEGGGESAGLGRLAWWLGVAGFVAAGGHEAVVGGLVDSVRAIPVGAALADPRLWADRMMEAVTTMPAVALSIAVSLALPALVAVLVCHLAVAFCARTVAFDPGQGIVQAVASLVVVAVIGMSADSWIGGFGTLVQSPIEHCLRILHP